MSENARSHGPRHHYIEAIAKGRSQQLNGNVSSVELLKAFFAPRYQQETTYGAGGAPVTMHAFWT